MRSERLLPRSPRLVALSLAVMACGAREASVGCSPTPSCSLDRARFEPPPLVDAGPRACDRDRMDRPRCAAERVALGHAHSCAMTPLGELLCWGDDSRGQLGGSSSTLEDASVGMEPRFVLTGAQAITAGGAHTCAIDAEMRVHCFGDNAQGQVDGSPSGVVSAPVVVPGVRASAVAAGGAHSCALTPGEGVHCWGSASHGQSGRRVEEGALAPGPVPRTADAIALTAGVRHSCALMADGRVSCWGELYDEEAGELRAFAMPRPVPALDDARELSAGAGFTCAVRETGAVACWGSNQSGQLGDGTMRPSEAPVEVLDLELSLQVAAGGAERDGELVGHACALTKSFYVQCWGRNREGQLGRSLADDSARAVVVQNEQDDDDDEPFLEGIGTIAAGGLHSCALEDDGEVLCWGDDSFDQLGASEPVQFGHPVEARLFRGQY